MPQEAEGLRPAELITADPGCWERVGGGFSTCSHHPHPHLLRDLASLEPAGGQNILEPSCPYSPCFLRETG